jgi:hypothetical protein
MGGCKASSLAQHALAVDCPARLELPGAVAASRTPSRFATPPTTKLKVTLTKTEGVPFGGLLQLVDDLIFVVSISREGLLHHWNEQCPDLAVRPGDRVISVNSVGHKPNVCSHQEFYKVLAEFWKIGPLDVIVERGLPIHAGLECNDTNIFLSGLGDSSLKQPFRHLVDRLPRCSASDCEATECAICLEDFDPDSRLVVLPCSHAFHPICAGLWFNQVNQGCANCCPLCKMDLDRNADELGYVVPVRENSLEIASEPSVTPLPSREVSSFRKDGELEAGTKMKLAVIIDEIIDASPADHKERVPNDVVACSEKLPEPSEATRNQVKI